MSRQDDLNKLITMHQRRLQKLKEQQAFRGLNAEPELLIEIEDLGTEIEKLQGELEELEAGAESTAPSDAPPSRGLSGEVRSAKSKWPALRMTRVSIVGAIGLAIVLTAGLLSFVNTTVETPVAIMIGIKPEVEIEREGTDRLVAADFGTLLYKNDVVSTYVDATATIYCEDIGYFQLPAENNMTVDCQDTSDERFRGSLSSPLIDVTEPPLDNLATNDNSRASRTDQAQLPLLLSPRNTLVADPRPTFHWQPVAGASGYRMSVNLDGGLKWVERTAETSLPYPASGAAPPLRPGSANIVTVSTLGDEAAHDKSWLRVLDEASLTELTQAENEIRALAIDEAAQGYLLAQLYRQHELWAAAIDQLEQLSEAQNSPSANLFQQLGDLYFRIELYGQAEEYFQDALTAAELSNDKSAQAAARSGLARTAYAFDEGVQALEHLTAAETLYKEAGQTDLAIAVAIERTKLEEEEGSTP